jgi:ATP-dependent DNA helicase RecQ
MTKTVRDLSSVKRTMRRVFGIEKLRPSGSHPLAIMPTGAGKSLCYQIPALHLRGTTIIISSLISLMKDQADKLEEAGIEAAQVNSAVSAREREESVEQIERRQSGFLFTMPEKIAPPEFLVTLKNVRIDFVVIDHCVYSLEGRLAGERAGAVAQG